MSSPSETPELSEEELEAQEAERLPDREAMSVVAPRVVPGDEMPTDLVHGSETYPPT